MPCDVRVHVVFSRMRFLYWVCPACCGWLVSLGYAPHYQPWLSFIGLVGMLWCFDRLHSLGNGLLIAALVGCGWYLPSMHWLFAGVSKSADPVLGWLAPSTLILLMMAVPVFMALASLAASKWPGKVGWLLVPLACFTIELVKQHGPMPFPWLSLGYTQIPGGFLAGFVPFIGVVGVNWLLPLVAMLVMMILKWREPQFAAMALAFIALVGWQVVLFTEPTGMKFHVSLVQGEGGGSSSGSDIPSAIAKTINSFAQQVNGQPPGLVVLPETALPFFEDQLPGDWLEETHLSMKSKGSDLLVGHYQSQPGSPGVYFNVAHAVGVSGDQRYYKRILVPFGEYVPFPQYLSAAYSKITKFNLLDTSRGPSVQALPVLMGAKVAIRLCYEDLFPLWQNEEMAQANLAVMMAKDDWFDDNAPMQQHVQVAQARAMESQKPVLRVGATGGTALIGLDGVIQSSMVTGVSGALQTFVQPRQGATPFSQFGLLPTLLLMALTACVALLARAAKQKKLTKLRGKHVPA